MSRPNFSQYIRSLADLRIRPHSIQVQCRRHASSDHWAKGSAARKNTARGTRIGKAIDLSRKSEYYKLEETANKQSARWTDSRGGLIPWKVLEDAHDAGFLSLEPTVAYEVVQLINERRRLVNAPFMQAIAQEAKVEYYDLTQIARLLLRSTSPEFRLIGTEMLFALSELGDEVATTRLVAMWLKSRQPFGNRITKVVTKLHVFAKEGKSLTAMALAGQLAERERDNESALRWYKAVYDAYMEDAKSADGVFIPPEEEGIDGLLQPDDPDSLDVEATNAFNALGRLLLTHYKPPDVHNAKKVYQISALKHLDVEAHRELANLEPKWTAKWFEYMYTAADAGDRLAQFELGKFYSIPESLLKGDDELLVRLRKSQTEAEYNGITDELWQTYQLTSTDLQALNNTAAVRAALTTGTPQGIEGEAGRLRYAAEWFHVSSMGAFLLDAKEGSKDSTVYLRIFFPSALAFVKVLMRALPTKERRAKEFRTSLEDFKSYLSELDFIYPDGPQYRRELDEIKRLDWDAVF